MQSAGSYLFVYLFILNESAGRVYLSSDVVFKLITAPILRMHLHKRRRNGLNEYAKNNREGKILPSNIHNLPYQIEANNTRQQTFRSEKQ